MKKLLVFLICMLTALALTGCEEEHKHNYTVRNVSSAYLVREADCENAATYFYSCSCGAKGTTTFTSGSENGHSYTVKNTDSKYLDKVADCENAATYFYSCSCGAKGTTTFTSGTSNGHSYVIQNVDPKYEKTPASEYTPAVYWKSCACGKASTTETFTHGDMLPGYLTYQLSNDSSFYIVTGFVGAEENITIPHIYDALPVFRIMANAFKNNTTLKSISMPNSIQAIGSYAFAGCTALESVSIPTSVKSISSYTFSGCTSLKTITLHSGIDELGAFSFENCTALKSITLNEGLETISDNAFDYCTALESISIPDTVTTLGNMAFRDNVSLKTVKFSKELTSIGNATFENCVKLESVELHENITTLGNSTFSDCSGLKTLRILGDLTSIGFSTFYDCRALESIYFASKTPGNYGNTNYIFYNAGIEGDGITLTIAKDAVVPDGFFTPYVEDNMPKITKIVIEDGNTTVGGFENYNKLPYLVSITYPASITDSAYGTFNNSLWWNNQEIGEVFINGIFYGYKCHCKLATPEDAVTGNYQDSNCIEDGGYDTVIYCEVCNDELKRTHTVIPEKGHSPKTAVEENRVEATCTEDGHYDTVVYCNRCDGEVSRETETIEKLGHSPKTAVEENRVEATCTLDGCYDSVVYCKDCNEELSRTNKEIIRSHKMSSGSCTVCGLQQSSSGLKFTLNSDGKGYTLTGIVSCTSNNIVIGVYNGLSVTTIGSRAFYDCSSLTSVTIGNSVTSIGNWAFYRCTSLTSITIPDSVTSIGSYAFYNCDKLVEVINHSALKITTGSSNYGHVGYYAKEVHTGSGKIVNVDDYLFITSDEVNYLLGYIGNDTTLMLPKNYNGNDYEIYKYAFYDCDSLTSITIPDGVTSIGDYAFRDCTSLIAISVDADNQYYKDIDGNLYSKDGKTLIQYAIGKTSTSFTVPNGVTTIGSYAFCFCDSLTSVTIPNSVTTIGSSAFSGCTSLTSIKYLGTVEQWNAISKGSKWDYNTGNYTMSYNYEGE